MSEELSLDAEAKAEYEDQYAAGGRAYDKEQRKQTALSLWHQRLGYISSDEDEHSNMNRIMKMVNQVARDKLVITTHALKIDQQAQYISLSKDEMALTKKQILAEKEVTNSMSLIIKEVKIRLKNQAQAITVKSGAIQA